MALWKDTQISNFIYHMVGHFQLAMRPVWIMYTVQELTVDKKFIKNHLLILEKFYFDTLVFSVDQLEFLIKKYGADHVAIGTDYPADMAEHDPVEHVYQVESITEEEREKICGLNALRLLNLSESDFK